MKALSAFYDYLLPELPGCTTALLDLHLVEVARQYCDKTRLWREDFPAIDTVANQADYDLFPPEAQAELLAIHKLTVNGTLLFDDTFNDWRWTGRWYALPNYTSQTPIPRYDRGEPPFIVSPDLTQITLLSDEVPDAGVTGGIVVMGSMKPIRGATALPDLLYDLHLENLRLGTLSRLMAMANKPWSAPAQSVLYASQYAAALNLAANSAARGNTRVLLRSRPH